MMKNDVTASAVEAVAPKKPEFSLIDENLLKSRIYTIRGVKVMLDADLAEIYGYSTKDFNRQVKNNIERFAEDFRFQLTKREVEELRSKKFTAITDANDAKDLQCKKGMRTKSWTQLEDASCTLLKNKSPRRWKHSMI